MYSPLPVSITVVLLFLSSFKRDAIASVLPPDQTSCHEGRYEHQPEFKLQLSRASHRTIVCLSVRFARDQLYLVDRAGHSDQHRDGQERNQSKNNAENNKCVCERITGYKL